MKNILFLICCIFILSGCVSYDYVGEKLPEPTLSVKVCTDSAAIPQKEYTVLGNATVSGNSQEISKEEMLEKLVAKAKDCGADIVLVTGHQVVPAATRETGEFSAAFDYDNSSSGWQQLSRDIDLNYGNVRSRNSTRSVNTYRRVIKARFIKLNAPEPAGKK
jgi:PBP1b-binding outer membrane lipoprotein LpoB